jgi:glycosyltransferase involved in cell wall biosynthesis
MKVLHIANMNTRSGVASFLMNYYRHIDRKKIQFDFLSCSLLEDNYSEEIQRLGGIVYNAPSYKKHLFKYINFVYNIIANESYDIIHCHQFLLSIISLSIAKKRGIKIRIIHSHNNFISSKGKRLLVCLFRNFWPLFTANFFACSEDAANFLFGKKCKYKIFNNAIEPERFIFNNTARNSIRDDLCLPENAFVIGYVARFDKQKNHLFLIDVFNQILRKNMNAYLLLVGTGILQDKVKKYVTDLNITNNILFYGISEKVYELYSAMDVFVFPSLFEGLPVTGIEAQCAGLPVVASLNIPKAMQITPLVCWLDLKSGSETWAEKVLEYSSPKERVDMTELITKNGYNINIECKKLEEEYVGLFAKQ